jgi:hypothetical protein
MMTTLFDASVTRRCGGCTLCCTMLPIAEIEKPRDVRCKHVRFGKGCSIYANRPFSCRHWQCSWLLEPELLPGKLRPDHSRVIFDPSPDYIDTVHNETGERQQWTVFQCWCDPHHPTAYRAPAVRKVIEAIADRKGLPTLVRIGANALLVVAPSLSEDRKWHETPSQLAVARLPEDPLLDQRPR